MRVNWLKDGAPLGSANRIRPHFEFGYITLGITGVRPEVGEEEDISC